MNKLQIFKSEEFGQVRTVIHNGDPWLVAKDVCDCLDIGNTSEALKRLEDDERDLISTEGIRGTINIVNEYGLYNLILGSRKPSAKQFKRWITHEVLPSIRKTGTYQKPLSEKEMLRIQLNMIDDVSDRVEKLENNMTIDYGQQLVLKERTNAIVIHWLGGKESFSYKEIAKKVFSECNHDFQKYFNVNSRNNTPKMKFDDAVYYLAHWEPCMNTKLEIQGCNAQISLGA